MARADFPLVLGLEPPSFQVHSEMPPLLVKDPGGLAGLSKFLAEPIEFAPEERDE